MAEIELKRFNVYRLEVNSKNQNDFDDEKYIELELNDNSIRLPIIPEYPINIFSIKFTKLRINNLQVELKKLNFFEFLDFYIKFIRLKVSKTCLNYSPIFVVFGRSARQIRKFSKANRHFRNYGIGLDSRDIRNHSEFITGFLGKKIKTQLASKYKSAFLIHLFYKSTLIDFIPIIKNDLGIDVIITTPHKNLIDDIKLLGISNNFPKIIETENKGRDILPFLTTLHSGILTQYDLICKIHGKKSTQLRPFSFFGNFARRANLFDLVYKPGRLNEIMQIFENEKIGLLGPKRFFHQFDRLADKSFSTNDSRYIADIIDPKKNTQQLDFFAGTMFWFRPKALQILKSIELEKEFEPESGSIDGKLEHAVERIFNLAVRHQGYDVKSI